MEIDSNVHDTGVARQQLSQRIDELNAALKEFSPGTNDSIRQQMEQQIAEHKQSISRLKPLPGQLRGAKAAKDRAQKRKDAALEAIKAAQKDIEDADAAIAKADIEIHRIESGMPDKNEDDPQKSLESLESSCTEVLSSIASSSHVCPSLVVEAEGYMRKLLAGLQHLSTSIHEAQKAQTANDATTKKDEVDKNPDIVQQVVRPAEGSPDGKKGSKVARVVNGLNSKNGGAA